MEKFEIEVPVSSSAMKMINEMTFQPELLENIKKYQEEIMNQDEANLIGEEICSQKDEKRIK